MFTASAILICSAGHLYLQHQPEQFKQVIYEYSESIHMHQYGLSGGKRAFALASSTS